MNDNSLSVLVTHTVSAAFDRLQQKYTSLLHTAF